MVDNLSSNDRKKTMKSVKGKSTSPERRIRALLAGGRIHGWRVNPKDITGKPDIVFDKNKIAIFIDGCFWHGCTFCNRPLPETNKEYWEKKIYRNKQRDLINSKILSDEGWMVIRIWEHEVRENNQLGRILRTIERVLGKSE